MRIGFNFRAGDRIRGTLTQGVRSGSLRADMWGTAHIVSPGYSGRTNKFDFPVPGAKAQPDGSHTLDLRGQRDASQLAFTTPDGLVGAVTVAARAQRDGWGHGDYYMLETDAQGRLVVEPGRNHRKIYVTAGAHGLTRAQIATAAGVSESTVNNNWLRDNPSWGATEETALSASVGISLWQSLAGAGIAAASNWLLFERGYTYNVAAWPSIAGRGESALHPHVTGAWGTGSAPNGITATSNGFDSRFYVWRDFANANINALAGGYWLLGHLVNDKVEVGSNAAFQNKGFDFWTQYDVIHHNVAHDAPGDGDTAWSAHRDRSGGGFWASVTGLLHFKSMWDHCGWANGYHPDGLWNNGEFGQPPSMYSHNVYVQYTCRDVDFDQCWTIRSASQGIMMRPGGRIVNCHAIDNGVQYADLGGNYEGRGPIAEYTLMLGNSATSAPYHNVTQHRGAQDWSYRIEGRHTAVVDNVLFHKANPDDPTDTARKAGNSQGFIDITGTAYALNPIQYKWTATDIIPGLDPAALDLITVQRFAAQELDQPTATIDDLGVYLRGLNVADREAVLWRYHEFIREGYGDAFTDLPAVRRTAPATLSFIPDDRGEGFRADNPLNWTTKDIPINGDSIELNGNYMKWVKYTREIASIDLGAGGYLDVSSGVLKAAAQSGTGSIRVFNCGQYFGPAANLDIVRSGRRVFTGTTSGDIEISGDAETLFPASCTVPAGRALRIDGGQGWTGWDGTGSATLTINGTLDMRSTPMVVASGARGRYRQDWPLVGENSGFTGLLDWSVPRTNTSYTVAIRDASALPIPGEAMVGKDSGGEYISAPGIKAVPVCTSILRASMPMIAPFRSGIYGESQPSITPTVRLNGNVHLNVLGLAVGTYPLIKDAILSGQILNVRVTGLDANRNAQITLSDRALTLEIVNGTGRTFFREA